MLCEISHGDLGNPPFNMNVLIVVLIVLHSIAFDIYTDEHVTRQYRSTMVELESDLIKLLLIVGVIFLLWVRPLYYIIYVALWAIVTVVAFPSYFEGFKFKFSTLSLSESNFGSRHGRKF